MKKYFVLAAVAVLTLGACSKNVVLSDTQEGNAVSFSTYAGRSITKANGTLVNTGNFATSSNKHIGVFAWLNASSAFVGTETASFMNNVDVALQDGGVTASDSYTGTKYWPKDADKGTYKNVLSFAAYYPYGDSHITSTPAKGLGAYGFTVDTNPANQTDFMISDVKPNMVKEDSESGAVALSFRHQLTKVQFYVKQAAAYTGYTITLKSIRLANVKTTGTLTSSYVAATGTSSAWSAQGTPEDFALLSTDKVLSVTPAKVVEDSDAFTYLMLPQTLGNEIVLTFNYTIEHATEPAQDVTATVKLNTAEVAGVPVTAWDINQNIKYTFDVELDIITFKADVVAWDAEEDAVLAVTE